MTSAWAQARYVQDTSPSSFQHRESYATARKRDASERALLDGEGYWPALVPFDAAADDPQLLACRPGSGIAPRREAVAEHHADQGVAVVDEPVVRVVGRWVLRRHHDGAVLVFRPEVVALQEEVGLMVLDDVLNNARACRSTSLASRPSSVIVRTRGSSAIAPSE